VTPNVRSARAAAGMVLVALAALTSALPPVALMAGSAATLVALVVYELGHGLAERASEPSPAPAS